MNPECAQTACILWIKCLAFYSPGFLFFCGLSAWLFILCLAFYFFLERQSALRPGLSTLDPGGAS